MDKKKQKRNQIIIGYVIGIVSALICVYFVLPAIDKNLFDPAGANKYNRLSDIESSFSQGDWIKASKMISHNEKILKGANKFEKFIRRSSLEI